MSRRIFSTGFTALVTGLSKNYSLIRNLTKRDVVGRYRGSIIGLSWSILNPLLMLAVYTFVFGFVFKVRSGTNSGSNIDFALSLFAGLIVHAMFAECINRAPTTIIANTQYVKKVVFPLEVLSWVTVATALFHLLISVAVLMTFQMLVNGYVNWTALYLPIVIFPYLVMLLGFIWFLMSIGVYLRDVVQIVGVLTTVLLFLSPIFYPVSALPEVLQKYIYLNPLTVIIEQVRIVVLNGGMPNWSQLGSYSIASIIICWLGYVFFQKTRRGFADVL
ncbi:MAG TPA: ABC transporter permease [Gammaproteobacteria bacterium]|nr:ABC transporter permease [Gammaproteobacteria bacterium]